jgi:tetratricopeptide (TPR) repeat protein
MTSTSPEAVTHLQKGQALIDNLRQVEAAEELTAALKLDPGFALARTELGVVTPGPDGLKEMEAAAAGAKGLPEPERLMIEGALAVRRGDATAGIEAFRRMTELVPSYARGHYVLAATLAGQGRNDEAITSVRKAIELDPNNGGAQNMLGYAALREGNTDEAIAAFNEYVRILPQEPNAQDSLGEALLAAGRFKEAEAAFQKALDLSPQFWSAHEGIAFTRVYAGDWSGGRDALLKGKASATRLRDKIQIDLEMSAVALAQRKTAEALQLLEAAAKTPGAQPFEVAFIPVLRAHTLVIGGRAREALAPIAETLTLASSGNFPPGLSRNLRRQALRARVLADAQLADTASAQKTSAALDQEAATNTGDANALSDMHFGRGMLAMTSGDVAAARTHFDQCLTEDEMCKWQGLLATEKSGDTARTSAAREAILKLYRRDTLHLIFRSRMTPSPSS